MENIEQIINGKDQDTDSKLEELVKEFKQNRDSLYAMIDELNSIQEKLEELLPKKLDQRYKYLFEERVKTIVSVFGALLDIRKEIFKSLKDEFELRRKTKPKDDDDIENDLDIEAIAKKLESKVVAITKKKSENATKKIDSLEAAIAKLHV